MHRSILGIGVVTANEKWEQIKMHSDKSFRSSVKVFATIFVSHFAFLSARVTNIMFMKQ